MMGRIRFAYLGGAVLFCSCVVADPGDLDPTGNKTTIELEAGDDGTFEFCDDTGECQALPNPDGCAVLVVVIDNTTGETCETCKDASGGLISNTCDDTQIDCVVVTIPDPDCVVCAHVGGAVIFSSCVVAPPDDCELHYPYADASLACEVCFDERGNVILDECPGCGNVICPGIACAPGFVANRRPGECCPVCVPQNDCDDVVCATTEGVLDCPQGTFMVQDPTDCCGWYCDRVECPPANGSSAPGFDGCAMDADCGVDAGCVDGMCLIDDCPPGFERRWDFPHCGVCVPVDDARYCFADADCGPQEICTVADECLNVDCGCSPECDDTTGECFSTCADCACQGICRSINWVCPDQMFPEGECDGGFWEYPGRDADGCPLPPLCVCFDGAIALDGSCTDPCANLDCAAMEIQCDTGYHLEVGYPYCCGACVPDDDCWTGSDERCAAVDCAPGYHCELGSSCAPVCIPDDDSCFGGQDCAAGEICSTIWGDCYMPPECDPSGGNDSGDPVNCVAVCSGYCVPVEPLYCYGSEDCRDGEVCTTELGDCTTPPECFDPGVGCPSVCAGVCEPRLDPNECEPEACGPRLGMPNYECDDGTLAGPTDRCLLTSDGTCGWEVIYCP